MRPRPNEQGWRVTREVVLHLAALITAAGTSAACAVLFLGAAIFTPAFLVALGHAVLLGLPLYLLLRAHHRPPWWSALTGGFAVGALPVGLFSLIPAATSASSGGVATVVDGARTAAGWWEYAMLVAGAGGLGAVGGLAFGLAVRSTLPIADAEHRPRPHTGSTRTWATLFPIATAATAILVAIYLPATLEDRSCHNPMRGRTSLPSEITATLNIEPPDWPAFAATTQLFARSLDWSYRGDVRTDPAFRWVQVSLCGASGTEFLATGTSALPGVQVVVYQPQGGRSWRAPFRHFYHLLQRRWPGRVTLAGDQGQQVAPPEWLTNEAH